MDPSEPLRWRKSTRSTWGGDCVEIADTGARLQVRDSKDPLGPQLSVEWRQWHAFLDFIRLAGT